MATIVVPASEGGSLRDRWISRSASWLRDYVKKSTGAELEIVREDEKPEGNLISLGATKMAERAGIRTDDLKWDGCKLIVKGRVLYLIGPYEECLPGRKDGRGDFGAKGTCKAVVTFLDNFVGVRWFIHSPMGERVPKLNDLSVPDNLSKTLVPPFAYVLGWFYGYGTPGQIANNFHPGVNLW